MDDKEKKSFEWLARPSEEPSFIGRNLMAKFGISLEKEDNCIIESSDSLVLAVVGKKQTGESHLIFANIKEGTAQDAVDFENTKRKARLLKQEKEEPEPVPSEAFFAEYNSENEIFSLIVNYREENFAYFSFALMEKDHVENALVYVKMDPFSDADPQKIEAQREAFIKNIAENGLAVERLYPQLVEAAIDTLKVQKISKSIEVFNPELSFSINDEKIKQEKLPPYMDDFALPVNRVEIPYLVFLPSDDGLSYIIPISPDRRLSNKISSIQESRIEKVNAVTPLNSKKEKSITYI